MSDPALSWSTSLNTSTSITSTTMASPSLPLSPFLHPPSLKPSKRRSVANKENQSLPHARPSLPPPLSPSKTPRLSSAPLTPSTSNSRPSFSSSPVNFSLPSPDKRPSSRPSLPPTPTPSPPPADENIRVVVRIRALPPSTPTCVSLPGASSIVIRREREAEATREYCASFDHVYDMGVSTEVIFDETTSSLVRAVVGGYNGAVLAYGQTSSGKSTHTSTHTLLAPTVKLPLTSAVLCGYGM